MWDFTLKRRGSFPYQGCKGCNRYIRHGASVRHREGYGFVPRELGWWLGYQPIDIRIVQTLPRRHFRFGGLPYRYAFCCTLHDQHWIVPAGWFKLAGFVLESAMKLPDVATCMWMRKTDWNIQISHYFLKSLSVHSPTGGFVAILVRSINVNYKICFEHMLTYLNL